MQAMMILGTSEGLFSTHPEVEERIAALKVHAGAQMPVKRVRLASAQAPGQQASFGRRTANIKR